MKAGVIGLGDMGSGLAKNLIQNGFTTTGFDLSDKRMRAFEALGGHPAKNAGEVGSSADAVFIMVMNGDQAKSIIFGEGGLTSTMSKGGLILLTATIKPSEDEIGGALGGKLVLIDSPVSGGFRCAKWHADHDGSSESVLECAKPVMEAVSASIHHVGDKAGDGQIMKACLQSMIGARDFRSRLSGC